MTIAGKTVQVTGPIAASGAYRCCTSQKQGHGKETK